MVCSFKSQVRFDFGHAAECCRMGRENRASRRKGKARVTVWHRATIQRKLVRGAIEVTLQDDFIVVTPSLPFFGAGFFGFRSLLLPF